MHPRLAELGGRLSSSVVTIIGTRPEAIKLAPVAAALAARKIPQLLIFTGQHPQLDARDHGLGSYPAIRLDCPGRFDPHIHVGDVAKAVFPLLTRDPPALAIVQGDTSSALGGALAARMAGVPVGHVEAGLRSHDRRHPWPEEDFRVAIDSDSDLLFAPTELSAANLRREGVRGQIHVTGNTGIDSVLAVHREIRPIPAMRELRLLATCHRRENWGGGIGAIAAALCQVARERFARVEVILHPNPDVSRQFRQLLGGQGGIEFREPCNHRETVAAMLASDLVLSDSGGMQEEAAALGVPLLVLREKTERPEAIASGSVELVGTDAARIVAAVRRRLASSAKCHKALPFGDGRAGERIATIVDEWLATRRHARCDEAAALFPKSGRRANA